ncbi:MAG TPA: PspC domain-containing protein [Gemmatimonadales bacterium]|nr:PspC domain-containing protein [Gemmatimonadales bacterium]
MTSASPRTLTRSTTDRKLSGVSGGLGAYLGIDPVLIRVGFVVTTLASGIGLLAYLALFAIVPADEGHPAAVPVCT